MVVEAVAVAVEVEVAVVEVAVEVVAVVVVVVGNTSVDSTLEGDLGVDFKFCRRNDR